jgi:hypothetical protein
MPAGRVIEARSPNLAGIVVVIDFARTRRKVAIFLKQLRESDSLPERIAEVCIEVVASRSLTA